MVVGELTQEIDLLVIGGGPGGYVAAIAAADAGIATALVEEAKVPGGVCLREGCIPSKALLHVAKIIDDAEQARDFGVDFPKPKTDIDKLRSWKDGVIRKLTGGVRSLLKGRKVEYVTGRAEFESSKIVRVEGDEHTRFKFRRCIVATGSRARALPESVVPRDLYWDAAQALEIEQIPKRLLIVGGGYIGLEIGQVYAALGSEITVIEVLDGILNGIDPDLAKPLLAKLGKQMKAIHTGAELKSAKRAGKGIDVTFAVGGKDRKETFDRILVSIGRLPNSEGLGLEKTDVKVNDRGFIEVDGQRRTHDKRIYAIGDVVGGPMLAHKAMREGKVAVEAINRKAAAFDPACIPSVVYTDPEVAWCGMTESDAQAAGIDFRVTKSPWTASGRAVAMGRTDGLTKMIFDTQTQRLLGVGIVGAHAGDLISEAVLAIEMAAVAEDISTSIHPHPATSETLAEAAEAMFGKAIHGAR